MCLYLLKNRLCWRNTLNSLDVKVMKDKSDEIEKSAFRNYEVVYKKITWRNYKLAAVMSFINRTMVICSNGYLLKDQINLIESIG